MAISNALNRKLTRSDIADGDNILQSAFLDKLSTNDVNINNSIDSSEKTIDNTTTTVNANYAKNWSNSAITGFKTIVVHSDTDNTTTTFNGASKAAKHFTISAVSPVSITKDSDTYKFDISIADPLGKTFSSYLARAGFSRTEYTPELPFLHGSNSFGSMWRYSFANTIQGQKINGCYFGQQIYNITTAVSDPAAANTEERSSYNPDDGSTITGYANTDVLNGSFVFQTEYEFTRRYEANNASIGLFEHFTATNYSIAVKGGIANLYSVAYGDNDAYNLANNNVASANSYSMTLLRNAYATNHSQSLLAFDSSANNYSLCLAHERRPDNTSCIRLADNYSVNMFCDGGSDSSATKYSFISFINASTDRYGVKADDYSFILGKGSLSTTVGTTTESLNHSFAIGAGLRPISATNRSLYFATKGSSDKAFVTNSSFAIFGGGSISNNNHLTPLLDNHTISLLPYPLTDNITEVQTFSNSAFLCGTIHKNDSCRLGHNFALSMGNSFGAVARLSAATTADDPSIVFTTTAAKAPRSVVIKGSSQSVNSEYYNTISLYDRGGVKMEDGIALFSSSASNRSLAAFASTASDTTNNLALNVALYNSESYAGFATYDSTANCAVRSLSMFGSNVNTQDRPCMLFENTFVSRTLPSFKFKAVTSTAAATVDASVIYLLY
jgi:hypothetical protein